MLYEEVFRVLHKHKIKYLVIGGFAVNLFGVHRLTRDLDLVIDLPEVNLDKFSAVLKTVGYSPARSLKKAKDLTAFSFFHDKDGYKMVDIFLKNPIDFKQAYKNRRTFRLKGFTITCTAKQDLIRMKEKSGRDRDLIDIGMLKKMGKK